MESKYSFKHSTDSKTMGIRKRDKPAADTAEAAVTTVRRVLSPGDIFIAAGRFFYACAVRWAVMASVATGFARRHRLVVRPQYIAPLKLRATVPVTVDYRDGCLRCDNGRTAVRT
ncbi:unnamed protein product, partial [Iphiclides podalirius]